MQFRPPTWIVYLALGLLILNFLIVEPTENDIQKITLKAALYILGVFFFIRGFAVYLNYLNFVKIKIALYYFFVFTTVIFAPFFFVFIGALDLWFDFRQLLKEKESV